MDSALEYRKFIRYLEGKMSTSLTRPQSKVLAFLEDCSSELGRPPTYQEIATHCGYSSLATVQQHVEALVRKGYITRSPHSARALKVVKPNRPSDDENIVTVPLLGRIAAGAPSFALEEVEEILPLPRSLFHGQQLFALRVKGDSMEKAGIFDGDLAVLSRGKECRNGDIAAVVVDEEATLKRVFRESGVLRLRPENDAYPDRVISARQLKRSFRLAGVLVGTIRQFC